MNGSAPQPEKSYFEQQRDALVGEIAQVPSSLLSSDPNLKRLLGAQRLICAGVGNEFGSVEALWSQFENVMAKEPDTEAGAQDEEREGGERKTGSGHEDKA
ncbi:Dolichyl-diphosphooligosaccharide-protein glycosyltransferase subunit dad1 [Coniosporium apollinis]|uniref:DASH complex subunit DAD1 n=2 Tax=Coniosporium TaxID=2810619 RepID=A0ABQ9P4R1_9PEZI|nr:Dolichyl-diphosphooligosaccharide-protein glycosyltransferase subunit dad1 [Cladosporium sp. JES 115]KAJ9669587.1 Dolichyl-diphosphooligosaccharide-protein glycosyltransferase subunit dad1 [Coniosporium apollinis]